MILFTYWIGPLKSYSFDRPPLLKNPFFGDDGRILLEKQYRYSGMADFLDAEPGQDSEPSQSSFIDQQCLKKGDSSLNFLLYNLQCF